MPTYDYICPECEYKTEIFHAMSEDGSYVCPKCGATLKQKISGGTNTLYKCSGFTQYKGRNGS